MQISLDLQNTVDSKQFPQEDKLKAWIIHTFEQADSDFEHPEMTIRIVSIEESQKLNFDYRGKDKSTNVLSFPFEAPEMIPAEALGEYVGDLVICEDVVAWEAQQQNKTLEAHWAHMVIHGTLHLLGFDHLLDKEAETMEALEISILADFDFDDPYI